MMDNNLYAIITNNCNLDCPHCDIKNDDTDNWKEEYFLKILKDFQGNKIIFGGEPTLHIDRIKAVMPYCNSISTNLLTLNHELLEIYNNHLAVATSWNPSRFSVKQYQQWLENVKQLKNKPTLLITLTPDLIVDEKYFQTFFRDFNEHFEMINFEQLLDPSKDEKYYAAVDEWLCRLYSFWKKNMTVPSAIFENKHWQFHCDNTFTLYPDGKMKYGCPEFQQCYVPNECYNCKAVHKCRPCKLQRLCTMPKKLMKLLNKE